MVESDVSSAKTAKPFSKLVENAVVSLKEVEQQLNANDPFLKNGKKRYKGTTIQSVTKFILQGNDFPNEERAKGQIKLATKRLITKKTLINLSGNGLNGRFKMNEEVTKAKKAAAKKASKNKVAPKKKKVAKAVEPTSDSESETESDPDNDKTSPEKKSKGKAKGRVPKSKVESKVIKKTVKPEKQIADLTKQPPSKKQLAKEETVGPEETTKAKAKPKAAKKVKASSEPPKEDEFYDDILNGDLPESDKENEEVSPEKPVKKTAKKTKIVPQKKASKSKKAGKQKEIDESPLTSLPAPVLKPKGKGKGKAATKKPIYSESEEESEEEY